jgi:hypothetical protein
MYFQILRDGRRGEVVRGWIQLSVFGQRPKILEMAARIVSSPQSRTPPS